MTWEKQIITLDDNERAEAQMPIIISASRSTDIPAFYADWFIRRYRKGYGYVKWINPFNGRSSYVSFAKTRLIVFWSKDPAPMLMPMEGKKSAIDIIEESGRNYYFQYTMNDYVREGIEPGIRRTLPERIEMMKRLSDRIGEHGRERVIWRFDPLILTDQITADELLDRIGRIGEKVKDHVERLVFSFIDINAYARVSKNLELGGIKAREFTHDEMQYVAREIARMTMGWKMRAATCGELADLPLEEGVMPLIRNKCIDDDLIVRCFSMDRLLMDFIGAKYNEGTPLLGEPGGWTIVRHKKDPGQRAVCGCIASKDIGEYNTCPHLCHYCYANTCNRSALANWDRHKLHLESETITGVV